MFNIIDETKVFDSTIRLQILTYLFHSPMSYTELKKKCDIADGAMTNHMNKLKNAGYITVTRGYNKNRPKTTYAITDSGHDQLVAFVHELYNSIQTEESS